MNSLVNKRKQLLLTHGYKTYTDFARAVNDDSSNVRKVIIGEQIPSISKLFLWASVLDINIVQILHLFYPIEMNKNIAEYNIRAKKGKVK